MAAAARDAPLLVGVGPEDALTVVRLAARMAAGYGRGLHLLHSFNWAAMQAPAVSGSRADAEELIAQATAAARESEPGVPVTTEIAEGSAVANLVRRSGSAFLLAIGDGGMAHCERCIPADSPAVQVAARADCPVLITPAEAATARPGAGRAGRLDLLGDRSDLGVRLRRPAGSPAARGLGGRSGRQGRGGRRPAAPAWWPAAAPATRTSPSSATPCAATRAGCWSTSRARRSWRWSRPGATSRGAACSAR